MASRRGTAVSRVWDQVLIVARKAGLVVLEDQEFADLIQAIMQRYLTSPASVVVEQSEGAKQDHRLWGAGWARHAPKIPSRPN